VAALDKARVASIISEMDALRARPWWRRLAG
jgi:hypothetical protein